MAAAQPPVWPSPQPSIAETICHTDSSHWGFCMGYTPTENPLSLSLSLSLSFPENNKLLFFIIIYYL